MKPYRSEMVASNTINIIRHILLQNQKIFDIYNYRNGDTIRSSEIIFTKSEYSKACRSVTIYYYSEMNKNIIDFFNQNSRLIQRMFYKCSRRSRLDRINFKYDTNFGNTMYRQINNIFMRNLDNIKLDYENGLDNKESVA